MHFSEFNPESSLPEEREGLTLTNMNVLLPDLLRLLDPEYLANLANDLLQAKLNRIDRLLGMIDIKMPLRRVVSKARGNLLLVIGDRLATPND